MVALKIIRRETLILYPQKGILFIFIHTKSNSFKIHLKKLY